MTLELVNGANPADEIVPHLWLGSYRAAHDKEWLKEHNISVIFNCTKDLNFVQCEGIEERIRIPVHDNLAKEEIDTLAKYSPSIAFEILKHLRAGKNVLVHCAAGMQRSAASVAFFLIAVADMTPAAAIQFIQERRPIAFRPRANFRPAIDWYYDYFQKEVRPHLLTQAQVKNAQ